ncbi:MAG: hypothetical protein QOF30_2853, partial [Acidimicrobiaceae bacterium]|nr:hypothetical protein [Acidimicrobiaceae bacterium]
MLEDLTLGGAPPVEHGRGVELVRLVDAEVGQDIGQRGLGVGSEVVEQPDPQPVQPELLLEFRDSIGIK